MPFLCNLPKLEQISYLSLKSIIYSIYKDCNADFDQIKEFIREISKLTTLEYLNISGNLTFFI